MCDIPHGFEAAKNVCDISHDFEATENVCDISHDFEATENVCDISYDFETKNVSDILYQVILKRQKSCVMSNGFKWHMTTATTGSTATPNDFEATKNVCDILHDFEATENVCDTLGPFIRGKIRRILNKTRTFRINSTFRLK